MGAKELLENVVAMKASDVFIIAGSPCVVKRDGKIERYNEQRLLPQDTEKLIREIYEIAQKDDIDVFMKTGDDDFSFSIPSVGRFRVNVYKQRNSFAAVIRIVSFELPDPHDLQIPSIVTDLAKLKKGLVLVTGPAAVENQRP